jgi:hypothetical protein
VKAPTHARRCFAAGFIPSLRQQVEFASGFDRYIEERRTLLAPEDVEILCTGCLNPVRNPGAQCSDCQEDTR